MPVLQSNNKVVGSFLDLQHWEGESGDRDDLFY